MGTSINQRSSTRGPWAVQHAILANKQVPLERQFSEIWRAALGDRDSALRHELSAPEIQAAATIAGTSGSPITAASEFEKSLESLDSGSIAVEFAKRSLIRATAQASGVVGFGADLFAEAISYVIARDLPSYVGASGRIETSGESISLKEAAKESARSAAMSVANSLQPDSLLTQKGWSKFVLQTSRLLAGTLND
jgi:hypothetical protein